MSEDSDYTSDVNYPLQHQHNTSAHQYGAGDYDIVDNDDSVSWHHHHHHHQQQQQQYYGYYDNDRTPQQSRGGGRYVDAGYADERTGYGDYYYYRRQQQQPARYRATTERSDSESEPLSYNSRPQSYYTDRFRPFFVRLSVCLSVCPCMIADLLHFSPLVSIRPWSLYL